jgi:hypothetical protein
MKTRRTLLLTLCAGVAACSPSPSPVPVVAEAGDLLQLAGEWHGHYDSPVVGRSGSIVFELEAGRDTAYGEVTMIPAGWTRPLGPADDPAAVARGAPAPETLRIRFIRVEYGVISGIHRSLAGMISILRKPCRIVSKSQSTSTTM